MKPPGDEPEKPHRIFVVGCPRSGTTLAQALLASHPRLVTLPETHFFTDLPHSSRIARLLGLASRSARERLRDVASSLNMNVPPETGWCRTVRRASTDFTDLLDRYAEREGSAGWLEKTPYHLHRIEIIADHVPGARFCHVLRRGPETVASLYAETQRNPDSWGGARGLERCVSRWLGDTERSLSFLEDPRHAHMFYDEFVEDPSSVVEEVWKRLGLSAAALNRERFLETKERAEPDDAPWQRVGETVDPDRTSRLREVMTYEQRAELREVLRREGRLRDLYWKGAPLFE